VRTLKHFVLWILCAAGSATPCMSAAPQATQQQETTAGTVAGRVIWEGIGAGIRKVVVRLERTNDELRTAPDYVTSTDAEGRFRLDGVAAGQYHLTLTRPGFVRAGTKPGEPQITVNAGQETSGLLYKMEATGVIAGKITEADGDPLQGVSVWVTRVGRSDAHQEVENESGQETTNDLGEFRIANLRVGQYILQAQAHGLNPAPDPAERGRQKEIATYATTFYPGTADIKTATPVQVIPGGTAAAIFGMLTSRMYSVSGTVTVAGNPRNVQMYLVSSSGQTEAVGLGEGGKFEFAHVLPGTYVAQIVDMSMAGNGGPPETHTQIIGSPIVISNADVTGLVLQPEAGGSVIGKVHTEDGATLDWKNMNLALLRVPQDEELPQLADIGALGGNTVLKDDGTFEMKDVAGATYWVFLGGQVSQFGDHYLKSVTVEGRETVDTGFEVHGPTTIDVLLGSKAASVEGTVIDGNGQPAAEVAVVTLPSSGKLGRMDLYQVHKTDSTGHFGIEGLVPGNYILVAVENVPDDVRSREFFQKYGEKGQTVDFGEGDKKTVNLTVELEKE